MAVPATIEQTAASAASALAVGAPAMWAGGGQEMERLLAMGARGNVEGREGDAREGGRDWLVGRFIWRIVRNESAERVEQAREVPRTPRPRPRPAHARTHAVAAARM